MRHLSRVIGRQDFGLEGTSSIRAIQLYLQRTFQRGAGRGSVELLSRRRGGRAALTAPVPTPVEIVRHQLRRADPIQVAAGIYGTQDISSCGCAHQDRSPRGASFMQPGTFALRPSGSLAGGQATGRHDAGASHAVRCRPHRGNGLIAEMLRSQPAAPHRSGRE